MDWQQISDIFAHMPADMREAWWRAAAGMVALVVALFWLESRFFKRSGRVGSWAVVRLVSVLAAVATVAVVVVPARLVGGPGGEVGQGRGGRRLARHERPLGRAR